MTNKTKNNLKWIPSIFIALFIIMGSMLKLTHAEQVANQFLKIGLAGTLNFFGIAELIMVALFLMPATMRFGFLLLTAYYGGAMAIELSVGSFFIIPFCVLSLVWVAAFLRDKDLFLPEKIKNTPIHPTPFNTSL